MYENAGLFKKALFGNNVNGIRVFRVVIFETILHSRNTRTPGARTIPSCLISTHFHPTPSPLISHEKS